MFGKFPWFSLMYTGSHQIFSSRVLLGQVSAKVEPNLKSTGARGLGQLWWVSKDGKYRQTSVCWGMCRNMWKPETSTGVFQGVPMIAYIICTCYVYDINMYFEMVFWSLHWGSSHQKLRQSHSSASSTSIPAGKKELVIWSYLFSWVERLNSDLECLIGPSGWFRNKLFQWHQSLFPAAVGSVVGLLRIRRAIHMDTSLRNSRSSLSKTWICLAPCSFF